MEIFDDEILNFWKSLNQNSVKYIIVGGFAVNLHGFSRYTADLDLWLQDTPANRKNFRNALKDAGLGDIKEVETIDFVPGWTSLNLPSGFELDIMTFLKNFEQSHFEACYRLATIAEIHGTLVRFMNIEQLIEAKRAAGRTQDLLDVEELQKIRNSKP